MPEILYNPKWKPPRCFYCKNFNGVTGMDLLCEKENEDPVKRVGIHTSRNCKKNNWFEEK